MCPRDARVCVSRASDKWSMSGHVRVVVGHVVQSRTLRRWQRSQNRWLPVKVINIDETIPIFPLDFS